MVPRTKIGMTTKSLADKSKLNESNKTNSSKLHPAKQNSSTNLCVNSNSNIAQGNASHDQDVVNKFKPSSSIDEDVIDKEDVEEIGPFVHSNVLADLPDPVVFNVVIVPILNFTFTETTPAYN